MIMDDAIRQRLHALFQTLHPQTGDRGQDEKAFRDAIKALGSRSSTSASASQDLLTSLNRLKRTLPMTKSSDAAAYDTHIRRIECLSEELQSSTSITKLPELYEFLRLLSSTPSFGDGLWHKSFDGQDTHSSSPESGFALTPGDGPANGFPGCSRSIPFPEARILLPPAQAIPRTSNLVVVNERELVRDLLTVVQGFEGDFIKLTQDGCRFVHGKEIETWMKEPALRIGYVGWMCGKLKRICLHKKENPMSGLCSQKLCNVLHEELQLHRKNMSLLDAKMHRDHSTGASGDHMIGSSQLTLRKFDEAVFDSRCRLQFLLYLTSAETGVKGGQLAGVLQKQAHHGDPDMRMLGSKLIFAAVEPLLVQLRRWIFSGYLDDIFQEFFINHDLSTPDDTFWTDRYTLRENMVPFFLSMDFAKHVLKGGKSVAFVRNYCQSRNNIPGLEVFEDIANCALGSADPIWDPERNRIKPESLSDLLAACQITTKYAVDLLRSTHHLTIHLLALRKYLLMAQGDVILSLIDSLSENLDEPANQLMFSKNLTATLNTATSIYPEHPDVLKSLDTVVVELGENTEMGWDAFSLEYRVKGPLTNVLNLSVIKQYKRIFAHLWRVKRADYLLSEMWREEMRSRLETARVPGFNILSHAVRLTMHSMMQFVQQLQHCYDVEVLQIGWNTDVIDRKIGEAASLDDILNLNREALYLVEEKCFIRQTRNMQDLSIHLRVILDHILKFSHMYQEMQELARRELTNLADNVQPDLDNEFYLRLLPDLTNRVTNHHSRFKTEVRRFTSLSEVIEPDSGTRSRLDFNRHYARSDEKAKHHEALNAAGFSEPVTY